MTTDTRWIDHRRKMTHAELLRRVCAELPPPGGGPPGLTAADLGLITGRCARSCADWLSGKYPPNASAYAAILRYALLQMKAERIEAC